MEGKERDSSFGLAAGLVADLDAAKADALSPEQITPLLAAHRQGDDAAAEKLRAGLRHLAYGFFERFSPRPGYASEDILGNLFIDLLDCIQRLRANDIPASNVVAYIRSDLMRSARHFFREETRNIRAKDSTNSERKKRGDTLYPDLARESPMVQPDPRSNETVDRLETPPGFDDEKDDLLGDLLSVCNTPIEREVVDLLDAHYTFIEVADLLGCTVYRVKQIVSRLKARL